MALQIGVAAQVGTADERPAGGFVEDRQCFARDDGFDIAALCEGFQFAAGGNADFPALAGRAKAVNQLDRRKTMPLGKPDFAVQCSHGVRNRGHAGFKIDNAVGAHGCASSLGRNREKRAVWSASVSI